MTKDRFAAVLQATPPLTPRAANALRLCLVWAFPHHLLRCKSSVCSVAQQCTIDIPGLALNSAAWDAFVHGRYNASSGGSREFTSSYVGSSSISSSDGVNTSNVPTMRSTIQAQGRRTYTASVLDRSVESYLSSFLGLIHALDAHAAWLTGSYTRPETAVIVFDRGVCEDRLLPYLYSIFGGGGLVKMSGGIGRSINNHSSSINGSGDVERVIYKASVTSKSQLAKLQEVFSEGSWRLFHWDIPGSGASSLVCGNTIPADSDLRALFLGADLAQRLQSNELSDDEYHAWGGWRYSSSKIKQSKLKILCEEDESSIYCGSDGYITMNNSNVSGDGTDSRLYRMDTIRNIPLAVQLVNLTRFNSNSDRQLKMSVPVAGSHGSGGGAEEDGERATQVSVCCCVLCVLMHFSSYAMITAHLFMLCLRIYFYHRTPAAAVLTTQTALQLMLAPPPPLPV